MKVGCLVAVDGKKEQDKLTKSIKDGSKLTGEMLHGLISQVVKDALFNQKQALAAPSSQPMDVDFVQNVAAAIDT